ncbi:GTP 3',8-cyclase [Streptomyces griseoloalbus]
MAMPLRQSIKVATYLAEQKLRRRDKFPLIVELEPLFACNLKCEGCGKIQHPAGVLKQRMPVAQAVGAVLESGAPMVSIAGGEPLMHPQIDEIVRQLVARRKYVFLCTNAMLLRKKMDKFTPSPYFAFAVHIDGLRERHDESVAKEGVFDEAVAAIKSTGRPHPVGHRPPELCAQAADRPSGLLQAARQGRPLRLPVPRGVRARRHREQPRLHRARLGRRARQGPPGARREGARGRRRRRRRAHRRHGVGGAEQHCRRQGPPAHRRRQRQRTLLCPHHRRPRQPPRRPAHHRRLRTRPGLGQGRPPAHPPGRPARLRGPARGEEGLQGRLRPPGPLRGPGPEVRRGRSTATTSGPWSPRCAAPNASTARSSCTASPRRAAATNPPSPTRRTTSTRSA